MKTTSTKEGGLYRKALRMLLPAMLLGTMSVSAQITETMDTVATTTAIGTHETNNGFDNDSLTFSGTGDVRMTTPSTGYSGASGGANVFLNTGKNFVIKRLGTNSCAGGTITMSFGVFKSTNAENGSNFKVEYSTDGGSTWTNLSFTALPTGSGTARWHLRSVSGLPVTCNLQIRFSNIAISGPQFRVDDVVTSCGEALLTSCSASITANDTNVFCAGGSVDLTANSGDSWLWSTGETTQTITVEHSGTYSVLVENNCCFATSAGFYVLVHNDGNENPVIGATVDNDTVCIGDSVTLSARTFARGLFFSQYMEGSSFNKIVEIYNGTGAAINLTDYEIRAFHNGACDNAVPTFTIALPSFSLADGAVYIVANPGHATSVTPDMTSSSLQFNGDDAVTLYNDFTGEYVDIIGSICHDPGSAWIDTGIYRTEDRTLTRRSCIYEGIFVNPNLPGNSGFPTLVQEWLVDTIDVETGFGSHTMDANVYNWTPQPTVPSAGAVVRAEVNTTTNFVVSGVYCDGCPYTDTVRVVVNCEEGGRKFETVANTVAVKAEAYPNPFSDAVTFTITAAETGTVKIEIFNMLGESVAVLNNGTLAAGTHTINWNGVAANGGTLAHGVYTCKVTAGNAVKTVMLVKSAK